MCPVTVPPVLTPVTDYLSAGLHDGSSAGRGSILGSEPALCDGELETGDGTVSTQSLTPVDAFT